MKRVFIFDESNIAQDYSNQNLQKDYTHIRAYHGCCTTNIKSYYENGILAIEEDFARQNTVDLFSERISIEAVLNEFNKQWGKMNPIDKSVWFTLTRKELLESCGHYLIYGSEFINAIAAELNCQDTLRGKGQPTIFHCDVPISDIPIEYTSDLLEYIQDGHYDNFGFRIEHQLHPQNIVIHEHPSIVKDPLTNTIFKVE
ncbi:hypothetical protein [Paenibacillus polymyxa]|uniref:hypothetical protein n=1 Tax=Paenibacillus polymyxa TaxID=1406 RepID=UPI00058A1A2A|nr:hypothetical protein [Paenibacillus polymyxa]AJE54173.1 hypothetical protein RE92_24495 [Paenibacillus polymyxa]